MTRTNFEVDTSTPAQLADLVVNRSHDLRISVVGHPDRSAKLRLFGVLDLATTQQLTAAADKVVAGGHKQLRLDLTNVSFCDGAGIGAIIAARRTATQCGGSLALTGVTPRVRRVLRIAGVDSLEEKTAPGTQLSSS